VETLAVVDCVLRGFALEESVLFAVFSMMRWFAWMLLFRYRSCMGF
jgi:hypothetical protein